jgi:WD40 repeat protein
MKKLLLLILLVANSPCFAIGKPELQVRTGHSSTVWSIAFSPYGKTLASSSFDGTIKLWDVSSGKEVAGSSGHHGPVYSVAWSPDGQKLASGGIDCNGEVMGNA